MTPSTPRLCLIECGVADVAWPPYSLPPGLYESRTGLLEADSFTDLAPPLFDGLPDDVAAFLHSQPRPRFPDWNYSIDQILDLKRVSRVQKSGL
jgi:hypothetical protein